MTASSIVPRFIVLVALGMFSLSAMGCGASNPQVVDSEPTVVPSPLENVRQSLLDVAAAGEFNSGTSLIKDELEKLRGAASVDVDALIKDLDALLKLTVRAQIQAKAKEMVAKLAS